MYCRQLIHKTTSFIAAIAAGALLAAPASAAEVEWRLGSQVGPNDPGTQLLEDFAKRVAKRSDGRVAIDVVPLETLGFKYDDALRVMRQGALEMVHIYPYYMSRDEPLLTAFMPHTVLLDRMHNVEIAPVQHELAEQIYAQWNLVPVAWTTLGGSLATQQVVCTRPVNTLEELRKVKLRHFEKIGIEAMNSLGVSTQTLPSSELYLALKTGVVDCSFYAPVYTKSQSLYEVADYWADIGYSTIASPIAILAREELWQELPDDLKSVMRDVGNQMYAEQIEEWKAREEEKAAEAFLRENGMTELEPFPTEDRREIREAMLEAWREQTESIGPEAVEIYERVTEALETIGRDE